MGEAKSGSGSVRLREDVALRLLMHFPEAMEEADLICEKCVDYETGVCPGKGLKGKKVIDDCMSETSGFMWEINPEVIK